MREHRSVLNVREFADGARCAEVVGAGAGGPVCTSSGSERAACAIGPRSRVHFTRIGALARADTRLRDSRASRPSFALPPPARPALKAPTHTKADSTWAQRGLYLQP